MRKLIVAAAGLAAVMLPTAASAQGRYYPQPPYGYGHYDRDVAREMRECRREINRAQRNDRYDRYDRRYSRNRGW
jgi:hypothetical protein